LPLNSFQKEIFRLIAANRNPESYVAGATVINRSPNSARFSKDIDIFHDPTTSVFSCSSIDIEVLQKGGLIVEILLETPAFIRALVKNSKEGVKLEWATDTAFRFFPVEEDAELGYRLHDVDAAINKCLALAGRTEVRDVIDTLTIHETVLHLGACCWAACGKDPGFTPELILELIAKNARITPDLLAEESLREPIDPKQIKLSWLKTLDEARTLVAKLNPKDLGCLYLNEEGKVSRVPKPGDKPHYGTVKGAWPKS
jgi:hypothetical protein